MNKTPGNSIEERERYWTGIVEEARRYPDGVTAYCTAKGISHNSYYYWFKRLRVKHPEWSDLSTNSARTKKRQKRVKLQKKLVRETEVPEKPSRRKFKADYKAKILKETDSASNGEVAAILRREGLYSSYLHKWREERDARLLAPKKPGRKGNPLTGELKRLRAQKAKLEKKLDQANKIIELQKKVSEILGITLKPIEDED